MLDALMRLLRSSSSVSSTVIVDTDNRTLKTDRTAWSIFVLFEMGGRELKKMQLPQKSRISPTEAPLLTVLSNCQMNFRKNLIC